MNRAVAMASARYVVLGDPAARSWLIGYAGRRWPLWRRETLSQTYTWVLHHAAAALHAARDIGDGELGDVLRDLHPEGAREGLGRGYTRRVGGRIFMGAMRGDTGETLLGEIPCPSAAGAEILAPGARRVVAGARAGGGGVTPLR